MSQAPTLISTPSVSREIPSPGDYLCSEHALYRVERVLGNRALIEDCRNESLIDVSMDELLALKPVKRASDSD